MDLHHESCGPDCDAKPLTLENLTAAIGDAEIARNFMAVFEEQNELLRRAQDANYR